MKRDFMHSKKGAMELTLGTVVVFVLSVSVLIMGIFLIQKIFGGASNAINDINENVKNEINKMFSQDADRKIAIYPSTREIEMKKGELGGFGFSIRNTDYSS